MPNEISHLSRKYKMDMYDKMHIKHINLATLAISYSLKQIIPHIKFPGKPLVTYRIEL